MKLPWQFAGLTTARGSVLSDFVSEDKIFQARVDAHLRRLKVMATPWPMPYYRPVGEGVGEIRVDYRKVEYRFYGYFGPGPNQFTVILAAAGKKGQQAQIEAAKRLKKQLETTNPRVEIYDV